MPTGYTADVVDGKVTDLRTFVLRCARAFGATIMQRDDDPADLPVKREIGAYYQESVARDTARVTELLGMTTKEIEQAHREAVAKVVATNVRYIREKELTQARYESMALKVHKWQPPSEDHNALKKFMLDQLESGKKSDCSDYQTPMPDANPKRWWAAELAAAEKSLGRSKVRLVEEAERCRDANKWIEVLYASL